MRAPTFGWHEPVTQYGRGRELDGRTWDEYPAGAA